MFAFDGIRVLVAGLVHHDEGAVQHVQPSLLDEQERGPLPDRDWAGRRQPLHRPAAHRTRRISIRPQPNARARPKPWISRARKRAGSRISSTPEISSTPTTTGF